MRRCLIVLAGCLFWAAAVLGETPGRLTGDEIIERMLARSKAMAEEEKRRGLAFTRRTVIEELDSHSKVRERKTREHAVTNLGGVTRAFLVRLDGRVPTNSDHRSDREREAENQRDTGRRRGRKGGPDLLDESLLHRFSYEVQGEERVGGRRTYVLVFEPKAQGDTGEVADRLLARLHGRIWVDAEEFELAQVESHLKSSLSILGGIAASLTRVDLVIERVRIGAGIWTNRRMTSYAEGRKVFSGFRVRMEIEQDEFREVPVTPAAP